MIFHCICDDFYILLNIIYALYVVFITYFVNLYRFIVSNINLYFTFNLS